MKNWIPENENECWKCEKEVENIGKESWKWKTEYRKRKRNAEIENEIENMEKVKLKCEMWKMIIENKKLNTGKWKQK